MSTEKVETVLKKVKDLIPYPNNPRDHTKSLPELEKSMRKHGFYQPMVIDQKDRIVCGHGRQKAAINVGIEEVPCIIKELTEAEYVSLMLSDNKIAELSKYKSKTLKTCLEIVDSLDTPPIGFSQEEVDKKFGVVRDKEGNIVTNFGDAGEVTIEPDEALKKKTFTLTKSQHEDVTAKLKSYVKEHELDNESQALVLIMKSFKRAARTKTGPGPLKVIAGK